MKAFHLFVAALFAGLFAVCASAQMRVLELGHEATPNMVRIPSTVPGELTLNACDACQTLRLRVVAQTRFFIGKQEVTKPAFTQFLAEHPMASMVVVQPKTESVVSRIVVSATAPRG
jgi:hypothetical protein